MNDDFLKQYHKAPPPKFAAALYRKISETKMNHETQKSFNFTWSRPALALAALLIVLTVTLFASPAARASAGQLWRQVGILKLYDPGDEGPPLQPTAEPPTGNEGRSADATLPLTVQAGFTVLTPGYLPDGYTQAGDWGIAQKTDGITVYSGYEGKAGESFLTLNQHRYGSQEHFDQWTSQNEVITNVTVRGLPGVWISGRLMTNPLREAVAGEPDLQPTGWLMWENQGVIYTLMSNTLPLAEMMKVAESLK
jgi:hypothetical protein